jgi:predicted HicB family RNase H-like nuclease
MGQEEMAGGEWNSAMNNVIDILGHKAVVSLDPEIGLLRGEFLGLNGGADFYGASIESLREEGAISLQVFLEMCAEKKIEPYRQFSGKFNLRLDPKLHEAAVVAARVEDKSLNEWIADVIEEATGR